MKKFMKVLLIIFIVVVVLVSFLLIFVKLYKPFGSTYNKKDKEEYAKRSEIFKNGKFENSGNFSVMTNDYIDNYKDRNNGKDKTGEIPYKKYVYEKAQDDEVLITWFGHSTILIQMHGMNILIDPVFEDLASPVSFTGSKRYSELPAKIEDLPNIDVVLITHDHYDHLSYKSIVALNEKTTKFIVPLGIDRDLEKFGIESSKIKNMAWWEEENINGLTIACTPSRHYSGRYLLDMNESLWSSWILKDENYTIFDSGDTGYDTHFKEIYEKYGEIDFAILDGAQYDEAWHLVHMFPEEAGDAAIDLHAKVSMLDHYGAFVLSNHSYDDPVNRFVMYAKENNIEYTTPIMGETININNYKDYQIEWWNDNLKETNTNDSNEVISSVKVTINNKEYILNLEDNKTARSFVNILPQEFNMNELNGNEKYIYMDSSLPTNSYNPKHINAGDVMLYGDNCLVIFYKSFDTSYSYTKIGHIDNLDNLGNGSITAKFEK